MKTKQTGKRFFGWRVMWAAFVVAVFGWGIGFYGPPVFLHTLVETRGWSIGLVSAAVTAHFLFGAVMIANMPKVYRRLGLARTTAAAALCLALGTLGWALAETPWQLFAATVISGAGWAGSGAIAINTILAPWFITKRPRALAMAYNGASIGGVLFSPLWVAVIAAAGFPRAALMVGFVTVVVLALLSWRYFRLTPDSLGVLPDGEPNTNEPPRPARAEPPIRNGHALWRNRTFITYAGGFTIGLFAQVGIIAHMLSMLAPALGSQGAGRTLVEWLLPPHGDRRIAAALTLLVQALGCGVFVLAAGQSVPLLLLGVVLFGVGIGNVTSLPPLIAQAEFAAVDVPRAIALSTAVAQGSFAFAPAIFGLVREWAATGDPSSPALFVVAATVQLVGAVVFLAGRTGTAR